MNSTSLTKLEIATAQLQLAVSLFLEKREYVSVVTLAGAAEEILGKLAMRAGLVPALTRRTVAAKGMYEAMWKSESGTKPFADLQNKARNEFKQLVSGEPIVVNIEAEALRMLDRAVENYRLLHTRAASFVARYEKRRSEIRRNHRDA